MSKDHNSSTVTRDPVVPANTTSPHPAATNPLLSKQRRYIYYFVSLVLWTYLVVNTFIYSVDRPLLKILPAEVHWVVDYKAFIFIAILVVVVRYGRPWRVIGFLALTILFPFVLLIEVVVSLGKTRNSNLMIGLATAAASIFSSPREKIILGALFIFAVALSWLGQGGAASILGCSASLILVAALYWRAFLYSRRTNPTKRIFDSVVGMVRKAGPFYAPITDYDGKLPVEQWSEKQLEERRTKTEGFLLTRRFALYLMERVQDYQGSIWRIVPIVGTAMTLIFANILLFATAAYSLYEISPSEFNVATGSFFDFFYYSFHNSFSNNIEQVVPVEEVARILQMVQFIMMLLVVAVFLSSYQALRQDRFDSEINELIGDLGDQIRSLERFVVQEYRYRDLDDAYDHLRKAGSSLLSFIVGGTSKPPE